MGVRMPVLKQRTANLHVAFGILAMLVRGASIFQDPWW